VRRRGVDHRTLLERIMPTASPPRRRAGTGPRRRRRSGSSARASASLRRAGSIDSTSRSARPASRSRICRPVVPASPSMKTVGHGLRIHPTKRKGAPVSRSALIRNASCRARFSASRTGSCVGPWPCRTSCAPRRAGRG
jgi:hypothetical protein